MIYIYIFFYYQSTL